MASDMRLPASQPASPREQVFSTLSRVMSFGFSGVAGPLAGSGDTVSSPVSSSGVAVMSFNFVLPGVADQQLAAVETLQRIAVGQVDPAGRRQPPLLHAQAQFDEEAVAGGAGAAAETVDNGVTGVAVHLAHGAERTIRRPGETV